MDNLIAFERLLFRATRGNMFLRHSPVGSVNDPNTNKQKEKAVFVVFYAGERAKLKITKVRCNCSVLLWHACCCVSSEMCRRVRVGVRAPRRHACA